VEPRWQGTIFLSPESKLMAASINTSSQFQAARLRLFAY
jgi:hypothetical protein